MMIHARTFKMMEMQCRETNPALPSGALNGAHSLKECMASAVIRIGNLDSTFRVHNGQRERRTLQNLNDKYRYDKRVSKQHETL